MPAFFTTNTIKAEVKFQGPHKRRRVLSQDVKPRPFTFDEKRYSAGPAKPTKGGRMFSSQLSEIHDAKKRAEVLAEKKVADAKSAAAKIAKQSAKRPGPKPGLKKGQ